MVIGNVCQPHVRTDYGFNTGRDRRLIELCRAENVAKIGKRHGRHRRRGGGGAQLGNANDAIGERKLGMNPQMDKRSAHEVNLTPNAVETEEQNERSRSKRASPSTRVAFVQSYDHVRLK